MKILSRNFSTKEKILIAVLGVMLLGLVYYKFVYSTISNALTNTKAEAQSLQSELDVAKVRAAKIKKMENEMSGFKTTGAVSKMGSYNYSKPETIFLNSVLSNASDYSISFDEVTRDGDQIRRNFSLQYKTSSYAAAEEIMKALTNGEYRCLISDVSCSVDNGITSVSLVGTFYETMVGGTPDSALPKDEAATTAADLDPSVEAAYSKN